MDYEIYIFSMKTGVRKVLHEKYIDGLKKCRAGVALQGMDVVLSDLSVSTNRQKRFSGMAYPIILI